MSDTSMVSTNANFGSSKMAGKAWVQQVLIIFTLQVYFLFLFFPTLSHPGPSLGILGGWNFCADRRGGGLSIEGVLYL